MLNEMCPRHEILWHLLPIDLSYYIYSFGVPGILFFLIGKARCQRKAKLEGYAKWDFIYNYEHKMEKGG